MAVEGVNNGFNVLQYKNASGVDCQARKTTLPNGMQVVAVQRADLPKGQVEMMSLDTFIKEELPNVQSQALSGGNEPNFTGENKESSVKVIDHGDYEEHVYKTEASTGKKWGVGIASAFIPGLGQAINGEWGKGAGFFFGTAALVLLRYLAAAKVKIGLAIGAGVAELGVVLASIVNAVKNAKSEKSEIVKK